SADLRPFPLDPSLPPGRDPEPPRRLTPRSLVCGRSADHWSKLRQLLRFPHERDPEAHAPRAVAPARHLRACAYPLLIHCKSGSDRTGLASALYRLVRLGEPPERAMDSFSYGHGHFPIGGPEHLHEPLLEYQAWLRTHGFDHTPARFRSWVEHD